MIKAVQVNELPLIKNKGKNAPCITIPHKKM